MDILVMIGFILILVDRISSMDWREFITAKDEEWTSGTMKFLGNFICLLLTSLTFFVVVIDNAEYDQIYKRGSRNGKSDIRISAALNSDKYLSYRVTETDSTITLHLYAKNDSLIYIK